MRSYWLKIGLWALLIFAVGFGVLRAGKRVKSSIESNHDLTIPLGSFVPFKLDGVRVGSVRSLTILRSAPKAISGFNLRVRTDDAAVFDRLVDCTVSVNEVQRLDERTSFFCAPSDSGFVAFGEVTIDFRAGSDNRTLIRPLMLRPEVVAEFQRNQGAEVSPQLADSIAAEVRRRVAPLRQSWTDSVKAAELEQRSADYLRRADSLKARSRGAVTEAPAAPVAPRPPKP